MNRSDRPDWYDSAACKDVSTGLMYPSDASGIAAAEAVCRSCPVQETCLEYAITHRENNGMWGGATERERERIRRRRRRRELARQRELVDA